MMFVPVGAVKLMDTPYVLSPVMSVATPTPFQPLTTEACNVRASLTLYVARRPVCTSGMLKNRNEREYIQFLLASMTSEPAVVTNLPRSMVRPVVGTMDA